MLRATCEYGFTTALGRVDMEFTPGAVYGIEGRNGSGKTTLLRTLAGELDPLSGSVDFGKHYPAYVGWPSFYVDMTVGEHVDLVARHADVDAGKAVEHWVIGELLGSLPQHLSSGQKQRVFLALQLMGVAAAQDSRAVLLDEPERHLDQEWTQFVAAQLRVLADAGHCVVVASHSPIIMNATDSRIALG